MNFSLYYHTLKYLKFKQLFYQIFYRVKKKISPPCLKYSKEESRGYPLHLAPFIDKTVSQIGTEFEFLNQKRVFDGNWNGAADSRLWAYNLNYMDYLLQSGNTYQNGAQWINRFIDDIQGNKCGIEPYPIALRGINWIKFISTYSDQIPIETKRKWDVSLFAQYRLLSENLEFHLLGNHLLEDIYSLLWAAFYFKKISWYKKASSLLRKELAEEVLPDGGHFELSPMYHEILLDRLLDCVNLLKNNDFFEGQKSLLKFLQSKAKLMLGYLEAICYRNGDIPLLNDSANGIAPSSDELFNYAKRLDIPWKTISLKESGYRKFNSESLECVIDVGHIGPSYIPGHAHADTFNYELRIQDKSFIIDSGISTYNKDVRRQYERGTAAHNTVTVDGKNSSHVWGGFRVAERAETIELVEHGNTITAAHNGFQKLGIIHKRQFNFKDSLFCIMDELIGNTGKQGISRIILHPEVIIESITDSEVRTNLGIIQYDGDAQLKVEDCQVSSRYNSLQTTKVLCFSFSRKLKYSITLA